MRLTFDNVLAWVGPMVFGAVLSAGAMYANTQSSEASIDDHETRIRAIEIDLSGWNGAVNGRLDNIEGQLKDIKELLKPRAR